MTTLPGTLDQPIELAMDMTRRTAATQGYALDEGQGGPQVLVLKKGVSLFSWGSQLTIEFHVVTPAQTRLVVTTGESFALADWGRGRRAVQRLFDAIGARPD